jgi:hypothetical protein
MDADARLALISELALAAHRILIALLALLSGLTGLALSLSSVQSLIGALSMAHAHARTVIGAGALVGVRVPLTHRVLRRILRLTRLVALDAESLVATLAPTRPHQKNSRTQE